MRALVREFIETIILALAIFLAFQSSIQNFRVEGSSMEPTLEGGQYLLVNKLVYLSFDPQDLRRFVPFVEVESEDTLYPFHPPRRGEIIIFHFPRDPSRDFVKRVIGLPGDTVEIRRGEVYVNDKKLAEPYLMDRQRRSMDSVEVPAGSYFVLGDNRRFSNDSRDWGPVPAGQVVGRAWLSYWPLDQWHTLGIFGRLGLLRE